MKILALNLLHGQFSLKQKLIVLKLIIFTCNSLHTGTVKNSHILNKVGQRVLVRK